jgi:hypothetical protein
VILLGNILVPLYYSVINNDLCLLQKPCSDKLYCGSAFNHENNENMQIRLWKCVSDNVFFVGYFGLIIVHFSKSQKSSLCLLVRPETMEENMILKIFVVFIFPYFKNIFSEVKFFVKSFPII